MKMHSTLSRVLTVAGAVGLAAGAGLLCAPRNVQAQPAPDEYTTIVKPIFEANCTRCHNTERARGGLDLTNKAGILKGGHDGAVITPGDPSKSLLIALINHAGPADDPMPMPPKSKLSDEDIAAVTKWIKDGASIPD